MHAAIRRLAAPIAALAAVALLAGCSGSDDKPADARTWVQKQEIPVPGIRPGLPGGDTGTLPAPGGPDGQSSIPPGGTRPQQDPNVVAEKLDVPWGLSLLPDGTALVGERPTGRIVQVQPRRAPVHQVKQLTGIQALLGIAVSPSYDEDGLIYAYVTTATDNRILRFTLDGQPTAILTGIPRGAEHNGGRIAFGPDGHLYIGTGDTGDPRLAADKHSLAGKILRVSIFGKPVQNNPDPKSAVYSSGFTDVSGLCWNDAGTMFATDLGSRAEEADIVKPGRNYGRGGQDPVLTWRHGSMGPGGCAVVDFGLFVGGLEGKQISGIPLDAQDNPGNPEPLVQNRYGRIRTVVAASDGALWATTSNRDGHGKPVRADDRVLRINPPTTVTTSPV
jgi:glucose/arabinose dehydrogenase